MLLLPTGAEINTAAKETTLNGDVGTTAGSGEGFNILAGYLFGNNTQERAMDMTTPVNIDVSPAAGRCSTESLLSSGKSEMAVDTLFLF